MCVGEYLLIYIYISLSLSLCVLVKPKYVHIYIYVYTYMCVPISMSVSKNVYACVHVNMYMNEINKYRHFHMYNHFCRFQGTNGTQEKTEIS